jgi:hypothetical protein
LRFFLMAAALLSLLSGCAEKQLTSKSQQAAILEPAKPTHQMYALGTEITPEGAVSARSSGDSFVRGGEVYLSVNVTSATSPQKIEVEWRDAKGNVTDREAQVVPSTARYVAFSPQHTAEWLPGDHRVVVMIDGRKVTQMDFRMM